MRVLPLEGKGVRILAPIGPKSPERKLKRVFAAGAAPCPASEFLRRYARDLRALPSPRDPAIPYLGSLGNDERDLWTTLLPAASAFQREAGKSGVDAAILLDITRDWAVRTVEEALMEEHHL
jgi:hypothetical protein